MTGIPDRLRHLVLPVFYLVGLGALCTAVVVRPAHPLITDLLIGGTLATMSTILLGLELYGARLFGRRLPGEEGRYLRHQAELLASYSVSTRVRFLAQAIACWFVAGISTVLLSHLAGAALRARWDGLRAAADVVCAGPIALRIGAAFLALDAWSYWRHRLEHAGAERGSLWRHIHRWHHTPTEMNVWTGMVVHPVEALLVFAVPVFTMGALGYGLWEVFLLFAVFVVLTMPQHMNSGWTAGVLGSVIHGPEAHTLHHSVRFEERNANYADCLTLWDRLFGTYRRATPEVFRGPFGPGS